MTALSRWLCWKGLHLLACLGLHASPPATNPSCGLTATWCKLVISVQDRSGQDKCKVGADGGADLTWSAFGVWGSVRPSL